MDYSEYGGVPLLGVRGVCVITHGKSNANAIKNAIRVAAGLARSRVNEKIEQELSLTQARAKRLEGGDKSWAKLRLFSPGKLHNTRAWERAGEKYPVARAVFDEADKALGFSISKMCFEGTEEELKLTANTQPAILTVSVAAFRVLEDRESPRLCGWAQPGRVFGAGGCRLVEFCGCGEAGAQARQLDAGRRGGRTRRDGGDYGTVAGRVQDMCKRAAEGEVFGPANLNSPEQTVISGNASAIKRAVEIASQYGAKRAVILPVSAPFHSALMMPAQEKLAKELRNHRVRGFAIADGDERGCGHDRRAKKREAR